MSGANYLEIGGHAEQLSIGREGLLVNVKIAVQHELASVDTVKSQRTVQSVLIAAPDVSEWNFL